MEKTLRIWLTLGMNIDFFYPDRPKDYRKIDIEEDLGVIQGSTYAMEVDCISNKMSDSEYRQLMQSLSQKQSELCTHIIKYIDIQTDLLYIFIEGGAGVGKMQLAKAIYQSVEQYYSTEPGENPDDIHAIVLAPTGMAAYHINGYTSHGLQKNIFKKELTPLNHSELNTL